MLGPALEIKQRSKPMSEVDTRVGHEHEWQDGDWVQMSDGYAEEKHRRTFWFNTATMDTCWVSPSWSPLGIEGKNHI